MPAYQYVGTKPETIVGLDPKNISEEEYDQLSWELQQAVLNNRGSDGGPLYVERPSAADKRAVNKMMASMAPDEPDETDQVNAPEPDAPVSQEIPDSSAAQPPSEPDLNLPLDEPTVSAGDVPPIVDDSGRVAPA